MTSLLLSKLAYFSAFPSYTWDTWLYIIRCYFLTVRMAGIESSAHGVVADVDLDEDHAEKFEHQRKHYNVTMAKFYDYRLQHRDTDGIALLWGDRLRHQYIVDVYVAIKPNHLKYLCLNRKKLRADVYQGL